MTTRLAAVRRGELAAFQALLAEHGAALERLARAVGGEARLELIVQRVWRDAGSVDATAGERAFVLTTAARDLARAVLPAAQRATPETDAASMLWHLARGLTGLGDEVDLEIAADAARDRPELVELSERWAELLRAALAHPAGPLSDPALWAKIEPRLR